MKTKIKELLNSVRFWTVTATTIMAILSYYNVIPEGLRDILIAWGGTVVAIGTADSIASRMAGTKS